MDEKINKRLAERLDALPNGFPPTDDGVELRFLAYLFKPEEADLSTCQKLQVGGHLMCIRIRKIINNRIELAPE